MGKDTALQVGLKLLDDVSRQWPGLTIALRDECAEMLLDDLVTRSELGPTPRVSRWRWSLGPM